MSRDGDRDQMKSRLINEETMWRLTAWAAALAAAWAARQVIEKVWEETRGEAPKNPDDPNTSWAEVAAWAFAYLLFLLCGSG